MNKQIGNEIRDIINGITHGLLVAATLLGGCTQPSDDDDGSGDDSGVAADVADLSTSAACGALGSGASLTPGKTVPSCKGGYRLSMQSDGNLVLYSGSRALWASHTNGKGGQIAVMQSDGNLVVYSVSSRNVRVALWASGTNKHPGARLAVQDDGNVVIYDQAKAIWATHTVQSGGGETHPSTTIPGTKLCARTHDGIPAYGAAGSCSTAGSFNVFTDDGIDTSTQRVHGNVAWKQTEGGYGYQCVELATRYFFATHNIDPFWAGVNTAPDMCAHHPGGVSVVTSPRAGDLMVFGPGQCVSATGHVAVIDGVNGNDVLVTEQNPAGKTTYKTSCVKCYLHAN